MTSSVSGKRSPAELIARGGDGNRTRVHGFAGRCLTTRPLHRVRVESEPRADDGIRTRDPHLGKVMRYQLRYIRVRPRCLWLRGATTNTSRRALEVTNQQVEGHVVRNALFWTFGVSAQRRASSRPRSDPHGPVGPVRASAAYSRGCPRQSAHRRATSPWTVAQRVGVRRVHGHAGRAVPIRRRLAGRRCGDERRIAQSTTDRPGFGPTRSDVLIFVLVRDTGDPGAPVPWLSGRASASHAEGRWFEPSRDHQEDSQVRARLGPAEPGPLTIDDVMGRTEPDSTVRGVAASPKAFGVRYRRTPNAGARSADGL